MTSNTQLIFDKESPKLSNLGQPTTEDFFAFGLDSSNDAGVTTTTEDPFWSDLGGDGDDWGFDDLPPCQTLFEEDAIPGENCDNRSSQPSALFNYL